MLNVLLLLKQILYVIKSCHRISKDVKVPFTRVFVFQVLFFIRTLMSFEERSYK